MTRMANRHDVVTGEEKRRRRARGAEEKKDESPSVLYASEVVSATGLATLKWASSPAQ